MTTEANERRVLIVLPRQLGDILLGSSLAFALRETFPNAHIAWLSHPMGRQLLTGHPALNEVHYLPVWKRPSGLKILKAPLRFLSDAFRHMKSELNLLLKIRREDFDLVVDATCTPRTAILTRFSGANQRFGIATKWNRNWAYSWLCPKTNWSNEYAAKARLSLLSPIIGEHLSENPPMQWLNSWMPSTELNQKRISDFLDEANLSGQKFVLLSPTSRRPLRVWPQGSYAKLGLKLVQEFNWAVIWLWGPGELEYTKCAHEELKLLLKNAGLPESRSIIPPLLSLAEVAELSKQAEQWIGNTNGLSHVAVAGGAKTVQIFGPTSPKPWTHPDSTKHVAVQREVGCINCNNNRCHRPTRECLDQLDVQQVYDAVASLRRASAHSK